MSLEDCFGQPCPQLTETFSFRRLPCRFEQSTTKAPGEIPAAVARCPRVEDCIADSRALWRLELVYGPWIKVTLCEPSSSIVVRSEHQFNKDERDRLAHRKHFYELSSQQGDSRSRLRREPTPLGADFLSDLERRNVPEHVIERLRSIADTPFSDFDELRRELRGLLDEADFQKYGMFILQLAFSALDCYLIGKSDRFGRYGGFLDLRPKSPDSPLALGLLAPPRRYRHVGGVSIITGDYGPLFGGPGFACTVYSMHDPQAGGGHCAQACVLMALGCLADRGAKLSGSYTLTYLAKRADAVACMPGIGSSADPHHLGNVPAGSAVRRAFDAKERSGLPEARGAMDPRRIWQLLEDRGVSARLFQERGHRWSSRLAQRLIEAYVLSRFPVIMAVDSQRWWPWSKRPAHPGHAVLIVGIRRLPRDKMALITHDPGFIPYYERPFSDCEAAAMAYSKRGRLTLVFAADRTVERHAYDCVMSLAHPQSPDSATFRAYLDADEHSVHDYRIGLINRDDLAVTFYARSWIPKRPFVKSLQHQLEESLERDRYWCIAALEDDKLRLIWVFDSKKRRPLADASLPRWRARLEFDRDGLSLQAIRRDGTLVQATISKTEAST